MLTGKLTEIKEDKKNNQFLAMDGDTQIGKVTYSASEGVWIVDHTGVSKEYGGQGIGGKLIEAVVDAAKKEKVKIVPLCTFAAKEFDRHPEYKEVLKTDK